MASSRRYSSPSSSSSRRSASRVASPSLSSASRSGVVAPEAGIGLGEAGDVFRSFSFSIVTISSCVQDELPRRAINSKASPYHSNLSNVSAVYTDDSQFRLTVPRNTDACGGGTRRGYAGERQGHMADKLKKSKTPRNFTTPLKGKVIWLSPQGPVEIDM